MNIDNYDFDIVSEYDVKIEKKELRNDYLKIRITVAMSEKCVPAPVKIEWSVPCCNVFSQWNPSFGTMHTLEPAWNPVVSKSRLAFGAPIQSHISMSGINRCTVALSDAATPCEIKSGIYEEDSSVKYKLILFSERINEINYYSTEMIIDTRNIPFYKAITDVRKWWEECGYVTSYVPDYAKEPMYSTWYSVHQRLDVNELLNELSVAKKYGMECVIVDDGWQTNDNQRGYTYCGDWEPEKISDMKNFVKCVHNIGMKYIMWYSVPFVGKYSNAIHHFSDKFLKWIDRGWGVLDPRYPSVREYLVNIYEKAVIDWDLDGLKLDFIDSFELTDKSEFKTGMDFESLEDGISALLSEIKNRLLKIKPDIMIEFRQNYIGPVISRYGNILRVADCPNDALKNRVCGINLRLTSGACAVHSDMLMWNASDCVESAALQIINVLFLVPQISVKLNKLPLEHKKMLKFYLNFWKKHKNCLLDGELNAFNPEANYSVVMSCIEKELIAVAYSSNVLELNCDVETTIFVNGTGNEQLIILNTNEAYSADMKIYSCTGEIKERRNVEVIHGPNLYEVPVSGMIELVRKKQ